jgi:hypothetical protein
MQKHVQIAPHCIRSIKANHHSHVQRCLFVCVHVHDRLRCRRDDQRDLFVFVFLASVHHHRYRRRCCHG